MKSKTNARVDMQLIVKVILKAPLNFTNIKVYANGTSCDATQFYHKQENDCCTEDWTGYTSVCVCVILADLKFQSFLL